MIFLRSFAIFAFLLTAIYSPARAQDLNSRTVTSSAHCYAIFEVMNDYAKDAATKSYYYKLGDKMLENNFQEFGAAAAKDFTNYWDVKRIDILSEISNGEIDFAGQAAACANTWSHVLARVTVPRPSNYDFAAAKIALAQEARLRAAMTCSVAYIFDSSGGTDTVHPDASKTSAEAVGREWARLKGNVSKDEHDGIIRDELVRQSVKVKNLGFTRTQIVNKCDQRWGNEIPALKAALDAERAQIKEREEAAKAAEAKRQAEIAANRPKYDEGYCDTLDSRASGFMKDWRDVEADSERSLSDKQYAYDRIRQHIENTRIEAEYRGCYQLARDINKVFETWERP